MRRNLVVLILGVLVGAIVAGTSAFAVGTKSSPKTVSPSTTTTTAKPAQVRRRAVHASIAQLERTRRAERTVRDASVAALRSEVHGRRAQIDALITSLRTQNTGARATIRSDLAQGVGESHAIGGQIRGLERTMRPEHSATKPAAPPVQHRH